LKPAIDKTASTALQKLFPSGEPARLRSHGRARSRRGEARRRPKPPMPARCRRRQSAQLNSGNSWPGYAPFTERPGILQQARLEHFARRSAIRLNLVGAGDAVPSRAATVPIAQPKDAARRCLPDLREANLLTASQANSLRGSIAPSESKTTNLRIICRSLSISGSYPTYD
jgi:hypothetical protein